MYLQILLINYEEVVTQVYFDLIADDTRLMFIKKVEDRK